MSNITPFNFDALQVRAVLRDGEPWFVAADVCAALGVANVTDALSRLDDDETTLVSIEGGSGNGGRQVREVNAVNESGLYSLILGSRKPEAKQFRRWVTSDVLPSIRRTGGYTMQPQKTSSAEDMETMRVLADALRLEGSARLDVMSRAMAIVAPHLLPAVPVYAIDAPTGSTAGSSEPTASLTTLLKRHGHKVSAAACNVALKDLGILEAKTRPSTKGMAYFWSLTEAGLRYGKNVSSPQNQRETQPHWYESKFSELAHLLRIEGAQA